MLGYYIFTFVLLFGAFMIRNSRIRNPSKMMLIYAGIVLIAFSASIDALEYGSDIMNYYNNCVRAMQLDYRSYLNTCAFEDGYATLIWLIAHGFRNPQMLLLVNYSFFTISILFFIYKNSKDPFLSLVVYVCLGLFQFYFTAFRQGFALAILLFAFEAIKRKKKIFAILLILFATLFHQTAIIFLPMIFLDKLKWNMKNLFFIFIVVILLSTNLDKIINIANDSFDMSYGEVTIISVFGPIINIAFYLFTFLLFYIKSSGQDKFRHKKLGSKKQEVLISCPNLALYMGLIGLVVYVMRFRVLALERVSFYFIPAFIILFPNALSGVFDQKSERLVRLIFVCGAVILFLVRWSHTFGEYVWIWS